MKNLTQEIQTQVDNWNSNGSTYGKRSSLMNNVDFRDILHKACQHTGSLAEDDNTNTLNNVQTEFLVELLQQAYELGYQNSVNW